MAEPDDKHLGRMMGDLASAANLGASGEFPKGQIHPTDYGELTLAVGHANKLVFLDFGTPTKWIGIDKQQALTLAAALTHHANQI